MLRCLPSVRCDPAWAVPLALLVAEAVFGEHGLDCVVTSGTDGQHRPDSHHYRGLAVDLRVKHAPRDTWPALRDTLRDRLGPAWDVLLELDPPHLHLEYDPPQE